MYQPKYTITNSILKNIGFIEAAKEMVENAPLVPHWEAQFRRDAVIRTIHYGTHLEGNQLNREQVEKIVVDDDLKEEGRRQKEERAGRRKNSGGCRPAGRKIPKNY